MRKALLWLRDRRGNLISLRRREHFANDQTTIVMIPAGARMSCNLAWFCCRDAQCLLALFSLPNQPCDEQT
jgi:hypothetical protein